MSVEKNQLMSALESVNYKDGYLYISGNWEDEEISLIFDMPVHVYKANNKVRENIGKVAVTRGPITYCLEECDNGKNLHLYKLDVAAYKEMGAILSENTELGHKIVTLEIPGKKVILDGEKLYEEVCAEREEKTTLRLVPYYAWNNRGVGEMTVWVHV